MSLNKKISIFRIWWEKSGKIFNASKKVVRLIWGFSYL